MKWLIILALLTMSMPALAERVDDFMLLDQHGRAHELYYLSDVPAIVLMSQANGCEVARAAAPVLEEIREDYREQGVEFLMINPGPDADRPSVRAEAEAIGVDMPIMIDETQLIGESLELERSAEVLVIDPASRWRIRYRGPIDDRFAANGRSEAASEHYLREALDAVLNGEEVEITRREVAGSQIAYPHADPERHAEISYSDDIVPILESRCLACHAPGGIGPWSMTDYDMVRGFAPMMREVLRTGRMPPWHADPYIGEFSNDNDITNEEKRTLVHWIEAGAPRGEGPDPLATADHEIEEWPLGEPDLVVTLPPFDVPATGIVDYQFPAVENPLDRDVWVRAVTVTPGDREVVHHALAGSVPDMDDADDLEAVFDNYLIGYAPGAESMIMPEDTGVFVPEGGAFVFQMHYTPSGRETTDVSRMALYFHDEPPKHFFRHHVIVNPTIRIPPHTAGHMEQAYLAFDHDAVLYGLYPHAHFRGRSSSFVLRYPDGEEETLLSVPLYDFNWQREYSLAEPVEVPAGSKLIHRTVYDNTARNRANPDPSEAVEWGLQSYDEMLYGGALFRWAEETSDEPFHDQELLDARQVFGFLDENMDGTLQWHELPPRMQQGLAPFFPEEMRDTDAGLDIEQFRQVLRAGGSRR